jgi:hypothetical protein
VRRALLALPLLLALLSSGCTGARGIVASSGDYAAYRKTRVAPTFEARLTAAARYLDERPSGRFREEVSAYFGDAEPVYWAHQQKTKGGVEAYLAALPRGPHHDDAARRLAEIEERARARARAVEIVEQRVSGPAAMARARVREIFQDYLGGFLDRGVYAAPLSQAPAALIVPYSLALPAPRCEPIDPPEGAAAHRCAKLVELPYVVEGKEGPEPREATMEIDVVLDTDGAPIEVTLGGPDLFLRLLETYRVKPFDTGDVEARAAATAQAGTMVKAVFDRVASEAPACRKKPEPPVTLELACAGVGVSVRAAAAPGEDDRIIVSPVSMGGPESPPKPASSMGGPGSPPNPPRHHHR